MTPAERLTYQGLIKAPLPELISQKEKERNERAAKDKMETEMMAEYMTEKFGGEAGRREANLRSLEEMANIQVFKSEFERLASEAQAVQEEMFKNTYERRKAAEKQYQKLKAMYFEEDDSKTMQEFKARHPEEYEAM